MREAPPIPRIRRATAADARAIAEVHVRSWQAAYRGQMSDEYLDALSPEDKERPWRVGLENLEPGAEVLVAEDDDGRIIGFAGFGPSHDEDASPGTGEVRTIYVEPAWFGKGIGRELFSRANRRLRELGYTRATLWVLETNRRTRRFYERAGWEFDGTTSTERTDCLNLPTVRYHVDLASASRSRQSALE